MFQDCMFEGTTLEVAEFHYTTGGGPASLTFRRCSEQGLGVGGLGEQGHDHPTHRRDRHAER